MDKHQAKRKHVYLDPDMWGYIEVCGKNRGFKSISSALSRVVEEHQILATNGFDVATLQVQGKIPYEVQP